MKFLLYAQAYSFGIEDLPDAVDHSGFSLLSAFSEILRDLGEVAQIHHIEEAEHAYKQCLEKNEACLLLSFTPPYITPITLNCPVIPVFAWEYGNIPEQIEERCWLDNPRHDWRFVLSKAKGAIVLSTHARDAIRRSMGPTYPVLAVSWPLPLPPKDRTFGFLPVPNSERGAILSIHAAVADSHQMGLDADAIVCEENDDTPSLDPADILDLPALNHNSQRILNDSHENSAATSLIEPGLIPPPHCSWDFPPITDIRMRLRGTVYTATLAPSLEQDNWEDLVTGFCWSFRNSEDATLMLVVDDPVPFACHTKLVSLLTKLSPFKCRVLAIYGLPSADEYAALIRATTYCVNTSHASGNCRHIANFLAAGVPAIAPAHTSLSDLISADNAFLVRSIPGLPRVWPHGDRDTYRTSWHQIDWQSLTDAFHKSHILATEQPAMYLAMSRLARERAIAHCSSDVIKIELQQFLRDTIAASLIVHHDQHKQPFTTTPGRNHDTACLHQHSR
ncbi:glycosyltransferase [Dyella acidisoli]|uniref:glycosyltransferase n=1 Tax=Dyella acidisoli TaxID=1867834 RepID=UPI0024E0AFE9|nr:hypothetical protein [Dyella acidisoli]